MFSTGFDRIRNTAARIGNRNVLPDPGRLTDLLEKAAAGSVLDDDELLEVINFTFDQESRNLILEFAERYFRPREREILLLPPLYVSSICENDCRYCSFSSNGKRLSLNEFSDELETLIGLGYRSIELVSSQDPSLYKHTDGFNLQDQTFLIDKAVEYFACARDRLRQDGRSMLTSNIPPLDTGSFRKLKQAGLDCYLVWLETFNPQQYASLHIQDGPKANQSFRLDSFERAVEAEINHLAGGFLKGLHDWRREEFVLYALDRHLKGKIGKGFSIIGTPRLKGEFQLSNLVNTYTVSDEEYILNIALDRILFDGILWLQTRESFDFNLQLIRRFGAGVILTLTSCTAPGGYCRPPKASSQFPVYKQDLHDSVRALENKGFSVLFDWDSWTLSQFQRSVKTVQA